MNTSTEVKVRVLLHIPQSYKTGNNMKNAGFYVTEIVERRITRNRLQCIFG
jgi:hypothetical protein